MEINLGQHFDGTYKNSKGQKLSKIPYKVKEDYEKTSIY